MLKKTHFVLKMDRNVFGFSKHRGLVLLPSEPPSVARFANPKVSEAEIPGHFTATGARSSHCLLAQ